MSTIKQLRKAAFIDRDGVLNDLVFRGEDFKMGGKPFPWTAPWKIQELQLKRGVKDALEIMERKGYLRVLITNQPDIATGRMPREEYDRIMNVFRGLPLSGFYVCLHLPKDNCPCRKPKPGMILDAAVVHRVDRGSSFMIGDLETDVEAGLAAGVRTVRVGESIEFTTAHFRVRDIMEAALLLP